MRYTRAMPQLTIHTNVHFEGVDTESLLKEASGAMAEALGKPEDYVMVRLEYRSHMMFGGTMDPAASAELISLDLPDSAPGEITPIVCGLLEKRLGIKPSRVYIGFPIFPRTHFGWNNKTFA